MADDDKQSSGGPMADVDSRILAAVRGLMVVLVPLVGIVGAYYSTRAALEADIRSNRERLETYREANNAECERIRQSIDTLRLDLRAHTARGPDGLSHPDGVVVITRELEGRLKIMEDRLNKIR